MQWTVPGMGSKEKGNGKGKGAQHFHGKFCPITVFRRSQIRKLFNKLSRNIHHWGPQISSGIKAAKTFIGCDTNRRSPPPPLSSFGQLIGSVEPPSLYWDNSTRICKMFNNFWQLAALFMSNSWRGLGGRSLQGVLEGKHGYTRVYGSSFCASVISTISAQIWFNPQRKANFGIFLGIRNLYLSICIGIFVIVCKAYLRKCISIVNLTNSAIWHLNDIRIGHAARGEWEIE